MLTTMKIVELLREKTETHSDYAVSKLLDLRPQTVSTWKTGRGAMGDETAIKAALKLGFDPSYVLACVTAERAEGTPTHSAWIDVCERLTPKKRRKAA